MPSASPPRTRNRAEGTKAETTWVPALGAADAELDAAAVEAEEGAEDDAAPVLAGADDEAALEDLEGYER